ncbi:DMT family transporter [Desulfobulbus elongatus]|uniref:DMT family transporter n=1 Tax=Desulfobulbus elongatus TaxID=53332 RepID=UPI001B8043C6|nr:DMT family transporter [Desulfobulbus elongatus]
MESVGLQRMVPFLALVLAMALWGSSFVALKYSFQEMHPLMVIFGRMAIASLCFLPFARSFTRMGLRRRHVLPILAMCTLEPCLYFSFESAALIHTTASQAAMITAMLPLLVALNAGLFLGERLTSRTVVGFAAAAGGAVWLGLGGRDTAQAPHPLLGNFLEFMAMVCAAGYSILMKQLSKELHPFFLTGLQALAGALFFAPVLLLPSVRATSLSANGWLVVFYLGTVVSVGAYGLYNYGISRIPVSQASAFVNLIPVFSIVLGFFLLDERLTLWQWLACGLVFAGVLLSQEIGKMKCRKGEAA